jgi:hypothetical protein
MLYDVLDFRNLFSLAEKRAIYTAAAQYVDIQIWLDDLAVVSTQVDTEDPRCVAGVQGLEAIGLIGAGRAAEILGTPSVAPPVGGYALHQEVRVLAPFDVHYPGTYPITGFGFNCVEILDGPQFDLSYIEAV